MHYWVRASSSDFSGTLPRPRSGHTAVNVGKSKVIVFGGLLEKKFLNDIVVYDIVGQYKINCDAGWIRETGKAGIGAVIRGHCASMLAGAAVEIHCESSQVVEARAIDMGLWLAKDFRIHEVIIESDAKEVVLELQQKVGCKIWSICPIICEIRKKSLSFPNLTWIWVPRKANCVAHVAALHADGTVAHVPLLVFFVMTGVLALMAGNDFIFVWGLYCSFTSFV